MEIRGGGLSLTDTDIFYRREINFVDIFPRGSMSSPHREKNTERSTSKTNRGYAYFYMAFRDEDNILDKMFSSWDYLFCIYFSLPHPEIDNVKSIAMDPELVDPYYFGLLDPDPYNFGLLDPDPGSKAPIKS